MRAIVMFTDGIIYNCKLADISVDKKGFCAAKYKDRRKYSARILILSANHPLLNQIQQHLEGNLPNISLETFAYTGVRLPVSQMLQRAKNHMKDKNKLYINETVLPNLTGLHFYIFLVEASSTDIDEDPVFCEADLSRSDQFIKNKKESAASECIDSPTIEPTSTRVPSKDCTSDEENDIPLSLQVKCNSDELQFPTVMPIDQPKLEATLARLPDEVDNNDENDFHFVAQDKLNKDQESAASESIDSPTIEPTLSRVPSKECNSDEENDILLSSQKCNSHELQFPTVMPIDQPKLEATLPRLPDEVDNNYENDTQFVSQDKLDEKKPSEVKCPKFPTKKPPRILNIETVNYDIARVTFSANATYNLEDISLIGRLEQHPSLTDSIIKETSDASLNDVSFGNLICLQNCQDDWQLSDSIDLGNALPMSSTLLHSTSISASANETEEKTDIDDKQKDKDYEFPDESNTTDYDASSGSRDEVTGVLESFEFKCPDKPASAPDDTNMQVADSSTPTHNKKYFCLFCHKMQTKLARHLELVHAKEEDVQKFINLPKGNPERQQIIAMLRKSGNHIFNSDRRFNDGSLLVCRRPNERMKKTAQDFVPCAQCKGQYAKSVIRHHWRKYTKRVGKTDRIVMVKGRALMAHINELADSTVRQQVFQYMREDHVVRAIRYDELLILFANKQCERYSAHQHWFQIVRARLRLLGRFLLAIKKVNGSVTDFASIYKPQCYDSCIVAVKDVAEFQQTTRRFNKPAVASNIGTLLKHVGELLRSKYIKTEEETKQKRVEDFLKLLAEDYGTSINKAVAETQLQNNRRKKVELPSAEDITKLQDYLNATREKYENVLKNKFNYEAWRKLAEATLVSLQIFNRRRAGEIERMYIEDFVAYEGIDAFADKEVFNSLSKEAQGLAKNYVRFMIRGKLGRGVPVLVPSLLLQSMNTIQNFRKEAKVPDINPYFFSLQSSDKDRHKYLRACDLLREFSVKCGAKVPNSLRGTKLRKHIATHCINLNLSKTQVSDLATFMGHHDKIHKDIYRQPIVARDITKISKLLELAQGAANDLQADRNNESESDDEIFPGDNRDEEPNDLSYYTRDTSDKMPSCSTASHKQNKKRNVGGAGGIKKQSCALGAGPVTRRSWSGAEESTVLKAFGKYLKGIKLPSLADIGNLISENKCLQGRTAAQVKTWIHKKRQKMSVIKKDVYFNDRKNNKANKID